MFRKPPKSRRYTTHNRLIDKGETNMSTNSLPRRISSFSVRHMRIILAAVACVVAAAIVATMTGSAATPSSGTLTDTSGPISYTAGPFFIANKTPIPEWDSGPECLNPFQPCDDYALKVTLPSGYAANHPNAAIKITLSWADAGSGQSDYDLYIYRNPDPDCDPTDCSFTDGTETADYQSAGGANPEVATISPVADGDHQYTVKVVPYTPSGETVHVTIELLTGAGGTSTGFGGPDPTAPGVPRYQNFYAPSGSSAEAGSGEFNIGFNPNTGRIMTMNTGPIWRITPAELLSPAKPECCEGLWEDVTNLSTITGVDPILWTDQKTGRTFASNSTAGANALYGFSDNDGDLWVPLAVSPPSGGTDHETIGSGPYPAALSALSNAVNQGEAVYYCSQSWPLGPATCQRSDTLGTSYGPGVLAYQGNGITQCEGLHGHVHVAPDGTVWLPVNQCGGKQGGAVSVDGGTTWSEFIVTDSVSQTNGADPSVGIDSNSTAYYCYVNNETVPAGSPPEGHVHVKVSKDGGKTWIRDVDVGASHGIKNAAHTEAVAGTAGRAACGFIGTDQAGDYQANSFPGKWYAFIATTYDEGQTWTTVNATPNDPVQSMTGVWQQGGSHDDRNLLDFNEVTIDDKGRVLYGYSDGCVTAGCIAGTAGNDFVAHMRVARQTGGKSLFASNDANTDTTTALAPKASCLSGTRDPSASHLSWKAPDNGGSDIVNYQVFRGTAPGTEVLLGQTGNARTTYDDPTTDPAVDHYYYTVKAVNAVGTGPQSNEIDLVPVEPPPSETRCSPPYLTVTGPGSAGTVPTDPTSGELTIESVHIGEPFTSCTDKSITFLMKVQTLDPNGTGSAVLPENSEWQILFKVKDTNGVDETVFISVDTFPPNTPLTPRIALGRRDPTATGTLDTRVCSSSATSTCPAISAAFSRDGTIQWKLDVGTALAFAAPGSPATGDAFTWNASNAGTALSAIGANTYVLVGAGAGFLETVQTSGGTGSYTTAGNISCAGSPVASLLATPTSGNAPLTVNFDASTSTDPNPCTTISSYTFNFGDGSVVTQSTPTIFHTYNSAGTYVASLTVTDSGGTASTNPAQVTITVTPATTPTVSLSASPAKINEGASATYTVTASSPASQKITVRYSMSGTATLGTDYTLSGTAGEVTIPAGQSSASVTLSAASDNVKEKNETAIMTLGLGTGYKLNKAKKASTVTIANVP
jgi:PKD repeat protein